MFENFDWRNLRRRPNTQQQPLSFQDKIRDQEKNPQARKAEQRQIDLRPTTKEIALSGDSLFLSLFSDFDVYNPDELVSRKGYGIYTKMLRDPQVKSSYELLINMIISRSSFFEKQNDDPINDEIIEFLELNINALLKGSWMQALRTILIGKAQGFSISEKVFGTAEIDGKNRWIVTQIKKKPYWSFSYRIDEFGNITEVRQDIDGFSRPLDPRKFIVYINKPDIDPVWGESELRAVYRPYWEKDIILRFQNIWVERLAGGFVVANPTEKAANLSPAENADLKRILTNITKSTGIKAPLGYKIDIVSANDTDAFENAIQQKNREISKGLGVPNLMGFTEQKQAGSQAQAKIQLDVFMQSLTEQADILSEILNEQLFSQLVWWNFGIKDYPRLRFDSLSDDQKQKAVDSWVNAVKEQAVVNTHDDENRTRELLKYPQREEEEKPDKMPDDEVPEEKPEETLDNAACDCGTAHFKEDADGQTDLTKRLDFAQIKNTFDNLEAGFANDLAKVNGKILTEFKQQMRTIYKNLPKDRNKIDYEAIVLKLESYPNKKLMAELRQVFKTNLNLAYKTGRKAGQDSLKEAVKDQPKEIQDKIKFSASTSRQILCKSKDWSVLNFIDGVSLEVAENYLNSEAFMNTKDLTDDERSFVHRILIDGIKAEKSIDNIVNDLEDLFNGKFGSARWNMIARTNITNIFVQAQLATYTDPSLGNFVEGLEYSAIMDNRTTVFCQTYHGRRFRIDNQAWSSITPPNHQLCRSVLIPITILDKWKESKESKSVKPAQGFG